MTHSQNAILRYAYKQYQSDIYLCNILFSNIEGTSSDINNALEYLEYDGLIKIASTSIGCAIIKLTDAGITYCEQTYA